MAKTICVALRKGGSGKTTTATNIAAGLQRQGKRTAFIDLDDQANGIPIEDTAASKTSSRRSEFDYAGLAWYIFSGLQIIRYVDDLHRLHEARSIYSMIISSVCKKCSLKL